MKVFFAASPRGVSTYSNFYKKIFKEIQDLGFTQIDDDVIKLTYPELIERANQDSKSYTAYANKKIHAVQESDICVFEVSEPSLGVGFLIQRALEFGKPVIVLYYKNNIPILFAGLEEEKLIIRSYQEKNLKKVLKEVLDHARQRRDRRFNFFINPRLLEYIEDASQREGITKSKFIRNLILEHMRRQSHE